MIPVLQILETTDASTNALSLAHERELYWIGEMERLGYNLLNSRGRMHAHVAKSRAKSNLHIERQCKTKSYLPLTMRQKS